MYKYVRTPLIITCTCTRVHVESIQSGFHLDFHQGGGGKDNSNNIIISSIFPSTKNDVALNNLIIIGGLGVCSLRKIF